MLLDKLGVHMACIGQPSLTDAKICELPCNTAADCGLINSFRGDGLAWLRSNFSHVANGSCSDVDLAALENSTNKSSPDFFCGGSKRIALARLQQAVRPQFRRALRWGMKNPHSTYYVDVLRTLFPCLVYVNTVRDLDAMVVGLKHFSGRVNEAMRFGVIDEDQGRALLDGSEAISRHGRAPTSSMQLFYGGFVRDVNVQLDAWLQRCMPGRSAHIPLQRLVAFAPHAPGCVLSVARPLSHALRLELGFVLNTTLAFAASSLPLVAKSMAEVQTLQRALHIDPSSWAWPKGSSLEPAACAGPVHVRHSNTQLLG